MNIKKFGSTLFGFMILAFSVSSCATSCPPICAGSQISGLDWRDRNFHDAIMVSTTARQALFGYSNLNNADLTAIDLTGGDLSNADLTGAVLVGANLREVKFSGAEMINVDLNSAYLTSADLTGVNFAGANLINADFRNAVMVGVNLFGQDLSGADLTGAVLTGALLDDANFDGGVLDNVSLGGGSLDHTSIRGAWFNHANLKGAVLTSADLTGSELIASDLSGCDLRDASLIGATLTGANFNGADLRGADLREVNVSAMPRGTKPSDLSDPYFQRISLTQWSALDLGPATFIGAVYNDQTKFPEDFPQLSAMIFQADSGHRKTDTAKDGRLIIAVEGSLAPLVEDLTNNFHKFDPKTETAFRDITETTALISQIPEGADIAIVTGSPSFGKTLSNPPHNGVLIGYGELAIIAGGRNPITMMNYDQFVGIALGTTQLYTSDGKQLSFIMQQTPLTSAFWDQDNIGSAPSDNKAIQMVGTDIAVKTEVAASDQLIGLIPTIFIDRSVRQVTLTSGPLLSIDAGDRVLYYPIYAIKTGKCVVECQAYIDLIFSDQGTEILLKNRFIALR